MVNSDVPIYRGTHICSSKFVERFRQEFCKNFSDEDLNQYKIQPLFENNTMPLCNILSHSVSKLRLLEFQQQLVNFQGYSQLIHVFNNSRFDSERDHILHKLQKLEETPKRNLF